MKNKKNIILVVCFVVVALISFYAGSKFAGVKNTAQQNSGGFVRGGTTNGAPRGMRSGGFVNGQILSKDANSITVQLSSFGQSSGATQVQQGSKIVFYTNKTSVMKTTDGTLDDLVIGKNISVTGAANPDGSVNAESIQIRPVVPTKPQQ